MCLYVLYRHVNIQYSVQLQFCGHNVSFSNADFLRSVFTRRLEPTFQNWPLVFWGPRQGQRGSNAGIVLYAQTCLFSTSYAARQFQTVPHSSELNSLTGCISICQHVYRGTDIILNHACMRMWSVCYGFTGYALANLFDSKSGRSTLLF